MPFHRGYDIACEYGTKIFAADAGTVIKKDFQKNGLGNYVCIDHGNGIYSVSKDGILDETVNAVSAHIN